MGKKPATNVYLIENVMALNAPKKKSLNVASDDDKNLTQKLVGGENLNIV